jgi:hypothetical protein
VYDLASAATDGRLSITPLVATGPLPVQLVDFTAQVQGTGVNLAWRTASEAGSDRFDIERSLDGAAFTKLGMVAAQGTTSQAHAYAFRDVQLPNGAATLYYRLRQVDLDGTYTFSPVRVVQVAAAAVAFGAEVYPNPWADELHVQLVGLSTEPLHFALYDAVGKLVLSHATASAQQVALPAVGSLPAGVYTLRISQGQQQRVVKLTH